ncbi:MAG: cobalt-precorrin-5B (C(1))-methyltransferase CbiD [Carboxydocellales bacterium]
MSHLDDIQKVIKENSLGHRLHQGRQWRRGYTTGSCAAAAAKAAMIMLCTSKLAETVEIITPQGEVLIIPIHGGEVHQGKAGCWVKKDAGDDPDITHGAVIEAWVCCVENSAGTAQASVRIIGGSGVGTVTKPGLAIPVGAPAINPVPLSMITSEVLKVAPNNVRIEVEVRVRAGETLARRTMNPQLGIVGGISILGTSGIVEPMSEDAFKNSIAPQLTIAQSAGWNSIVLTPGRMGQKQAIELYGLPEGAVVQMSNFVGFMLEECARLKLGRVMLFGHIGKLVKVAGGIFHTHNRVANARLEIITAYAGLLGANHRVLAMLMECITVEGALQIINTAGLQEIFSLLASKAGERAEAFVHQDLEVGVVFTDLQGKILGWNDRASKIGGDLGWNFQSGL